MLSEKQKKLSLYSALFVALIDYLGISLVYPMLSAMLFDPNYHILPPETSNALRGIFLGVLFCLFPLAQFFTSPLWGTLSDSKGRKKPLLYSLLFSLAGYLLALCGVYMSSLFFLFVARILIGIGAGNASIVQASIADISTEETKTKNFGLHSMVLGLGFSVGPFFGGYLSARSYSPPFILTTALVVLNILFIILFFTETEKEKKTTNMSWNKGFIALGTALQNSSIRPILLAAFLIHFGWSYFFEFTPVFLMQKFSWSVSLTGVFLGLSGLFYAISSGWLIRPFIKRLKPSSMLFLGLLFSSITVFFIPRITDGFLIFFLIFFVDFFLSFINPAATTLLSNKTAQDAQGEILGVLTSVISAAFALSPLFAGLVAGSYPSLPFYIGGSCMFLASIVYRLPSYAKKIPL